MCVLHVNVCLCTYVFWRYRWLAWATSILRDLLKRFIRLFRVDDEESSCLYTDMNTHTYYISLLIILIVTYEQVGSLISCFLFRQMNNPRVLASGSGYVPVFVILELTIPNGTLKQVVWYILPLHIRSQCLCVLYVCVCLCVFVHIHINWFIFDSTFFFSHKSWFINT